MGNQLAGTVPTQILPVEHYFQEIPDFQYVSSLGSTRFLKVALAKHKETFVVIKVFILHDPTLPLEHYKQKLELLYNELSPERNCLPYSQPLVFDKAVFLTRQYVKSNCYDRLSTRPFLTLLEKKWIAFQLLKGLQFCHAKGLCHGDIKLENILVTSWLWVLLTDFASFKPAFLPEDNPADFSYFFDTSRRRTCYIAPERFQLTPVSSENLLPLNQSMVLDTPSFPSHLNPAMDIFSAGCSLIELFAEGQAPFDFAQLLAYRSQEISKTPVLEKIEDRDIRDFLENMIELDPAKRKTADCCLQEQCDKIFPKTFYNFLYDYMRILTQPQWGPADPKIDKMHLDLPELTEKLKSDGTLLLVANIVLSSLRSLQYSSSKLKALEILSQIAPYLGDEILLDRLLPYIVHFMMDNHSAVRSCALKALANVLASIQYLPRGDANVFTEYILPAIASRVQDESVLVRSTLAQKMADLADIAQKFLELSHSRVDSHVMTPTVEQPYGVVNPHSRSYEVELQTLQESFQSLVACLLTDSESQVRRTLLEYSVTRLCVFFGRPKASDVIFSHVITFLNDKNDRHLRGSFFESLAGVVSYIGWVCAPICQPLLQQGLTDAEECVTVNAIESMVALTQTGLLPKSALLGLLRDTVPYLLHPNRWIRFATAGFVCCASRHLNPVDVKCRLSAIVDPFLSYRIPLEKEHLLLDALYAPVPRVIWDSIVKCPDIHLLLSTLAERQHSKRQGQEWIPHPAEIGGPIKNLLRRLCSEGLTTCNEEQILRMKDHLIKLRSHKQALQFNQQPWNDQGLINLSSLKMPPNQLRSTEIPKGLFSRFQHLEVQQLTKPDTSSKTDEAALASASMNPEWQHMFGLPPSTNTDQEKRDFESAEILHAEEEKGSRLAFNTLPCNGELNRLIIHRSIEERSIALTRQVVASGVEGRAYTVKSLDWSPKGMLLSHLHEHRASVTRLTNLGNSTYFASASLDGSIKIWDCGRLESRSIANRSRQTYGRAGAGVTSLISLQSGTCLACSTTKGAIQVIRVETGHVVSRAPVTFKQIDLNKQGSIADLQSLNYGNQSVLIYATVMGSILCWDFRCAEPAWKADHCLKNGIITSMCVDPSQNWFGVGTDSGAHVCWDLRFRLPVSCVYHPSSSRVLRLLSHPANSSQFVSAVENNNEVSLWNWENQSRSMAVWAGSSSPLSSRTTAGPNPYAAFIGCRTAHQNQPFLLTGGSDLKLRFWDLVQAEQSFIFSNGACDPDRVTPAADVSYSSRLVDGVEVIHEIRHPIPSHSGSPRGQHIQNPFNTAYNMPDGKASNPIGVTVTDYNPPFGHADVISDITMIEGAQPYIVSGSKDGVIKVWM